MSIIRQFSIWATVVALSQVPTTGLAGGGEGGGGGSGDGGDSGGYGLSNATTRSVVKTLSLGGTRCGKQPAAYRCDCYRWVYKRAASELARNGAYSEAQQALEQVANRLETLVRQNRDTRQPTRRRALETYTPVKPASLPKVTRSAVQAMTNAETLLLRSAPRKQEHYARIAQAVQSNKVLLRSAFLPGGMIRLASAVLNRLQHRS